MNPWSSKTETALWLSLIHISCHANSARDALARIETMVLMAGTELPSRAIREQISSALNLIVHQNRLKDGTRKITAISEIVGMEGNTITPCLLYTSYRNPMIMK